jgi:hypothetical protein
MVKTPGTGCAVPHSQLSKRQEQTRAQLREKYIIDHWGPRHIGGATGAASGLLAPQIKDDDPW